MRIGKRAIFDSRVDYVRTEVDLGLTFAGIAAEAGSHERFLRNRNNAQRAYDTARHFMQRIELSDGQAADLLAMLEELERRLQILDHASPPTPAPMSEA